MSSEDVRNEPHHTGEDLVPSRLRRFIPLLAVAGISAAVMGYLSGTREPAMKSRVALPPAVPKTAVPPAVKYAELPSAKLGPNSGWTQSLSDLKSDRPGNYDPVTRTDAMKLAALTDRARNRAFDGAPPTIPHPVDVHSTAACLACHGEGLKVGDRIASRISHANLSNCTQCHVEQSPGGISVPAVSVDTGFVGLYRAGPGPRASPGAPPTIPHRTWMRENCISCHGLVTRPGTRTTHPWLTNCTQCHAPNAVLDQADFTGGMP